MKNKITSNLSESQKQDLYKNARKDKTYGDIWVNVGKCVFCDLRDKYLVYEENGIVLTVSLYPYIDGQLMAIPRRHVNSPKELSEIEWATLRKMGYIAKKLIKEEYGHKGMWHLIREGGASAQMSVSDHLHMQFTPFDNPDLCNWNYRDIKYSPLESAQKYRALFKQINKSSIKFDEKYSSNVMVPVVCDVLLVNSKKEILLQTRNEYSEIKNLKYVLPGGHVDSVDISVEEALKREVFEEINFNIEIKNLKLLASRFSRITHLNKLSYLDHVIDSPTRFLWNTYLYKLDKDYLKFIPKDDCKDIVWVSLEEVGSLEGLSIELKELISNFNKD